MIIINKIQLDENNQINFEDYGHISNQSLINQINQNYDHSLGIYIADNRTNLELGTTDLSPFFANNPIVFEARTEVSTIDGLGLSEITSLSQLI